MFSSVRLISSLAWNQPSPRRAWLARRLSCVAWLFALVVTPIAIAGSPVVQGRTFIPSGTDGTFEPSVIEPFLDSSIVIAGTNDSYFRPWAAKVNPAGKTIWIYKRRSENLPDIYGKPTIEGIYVSAITMPDGSVYLCGTAPHYTGQPSSGLISHIDPMGNLISETLIHAPTNIASQSFSVKACVVTDGGILAVGSDSWKTFEAAFVRKGEVLWQTQSDGFAPFFFNHASPERTTLKAEPNGFFVSMTDNQKTELLRLDVNGRTRAHATLIGGYIMVRSTGETTKTEMFGPTPVSHSGERRIVQLDDALAQTTEATGSDPASFEPNTVYRLPDGSLAFFGTSLHLLGRSLRAAVALTDARITRGRVWDVPDDVESDGGRIRASAYVRASGNFAIGRVQATPEQVGAILNLIKLK